jgi:hypothetical protein
MTILNNREEYLKALQSILPTNPTCMEIGVHLGGFSRSLLDSLNPKKLHLIDPFENGVDPISKQEIYNELQIKTVYSDERCLSEVHKLLSNEIEQNIVCINRKLSNEALSDYEDESFDFIYIDACHLYESIKWDLENYIGKVKKGGYIGGHDYFPHADFGVIQAVDEFCKSNDYEIILLVQPNQHGDWLLSAKK